MGTKQCRKCQVLKSLDDFYKRKNAIDGRYNVCRECAKDDTKEWKKNLPKDRKKTYARASVVAQYNLTLDEYDDMVERQNGVCAICFSPPVRDAYLAVDHDRKCCSSKTSCGNCVRELLCIKCNTGFAMVDENISTLLEMIAYKLRHSR